MSYSAVDSSLKGIKAYGKPVAFASTQRKPFEVMDYSHLGYGFCVVSHDLKATVLYNQDRIAANVAARNLNRMSGAR